jgi:toxic protein SymE
MADKQKKTVKLQPKHRQLAWGNYKVVPWLTLSGIWLEENGFKIGQQVEITVKQNELIIKTQS